MGGFELSNNGQGIDFNLFKDKLNLSDVSVSLKFQQIFNFFDKDGNGVLEVSNNNGVNEIGSMLKGMSKYASVNGNSIFEEDEVQQYLAETVDSDGATLTSKNISVNDIFNFLKVLSIQEDSSSVKTEAYASEALTESELQETAIETLTEDSNRARKIFNKQNLSQGSVKNSINWVKEVFNTENAATNIDRALLIEDFSAYLLHRAGSEEGLTYREYYEAQIEFITQMFAKFNKSTDEIKLQRCREGLKKLEPQRLNWIIQAIGTITDNITAEEMPNVLSDIVSQQFETQNFFPSNLQVYNPELPNARSPKPQITTVENLEKSGQLDKKLDFETAFEMERGVKYDKEAINDYALKSTHLQILTGMSNDIAAIDMFLEMLREDKGELYCSAQLVEEINNFLQKFQQHVSPSRADILTTLINLRDKAQENFDKALGGRSLEDYSADAAEAYKKAYGNNNITDVVNRYIESQEGAYQTLKTGVQVAGMVVMVAGQCIPVGGQVAATMIYGGMATATLGGTALDAAENFTKEGGATEQDKKEMVQELATAIALTAAGTGIGKVSESAFRMMVLKNCPKLLAWTAEVGIDATLSLVADAAITGEISLSGEGMSQLINVLVGVIRTKGDFKSYLNTHAGKTDTSKDKHIRQDFGLQKSSIKFPIVTETTEVSSIDGTIIHKKFIRNQDGSTIHEKTITTNEWMPDDEFTYEGHLEFKYQKEKTITDRNGYRTTESEIILPNGEKHIERIDIDGNSYKEIRSSDGTMKKITTFKNPDGSSYTLVSKNKIRTVEARDHIESIGIDFKNGGVNGGHDINIYRNIDNINLKGISSTAEVNIIKSNEIDNNTLVPLRIEIRVKEQVNSSNISRKGLIMEYQAGPPAYYRTKSVTYDSDWKIKCDDNGPIETHSQQPKNLMSHELIDTLITRMNTRPNDCQTYYIHTNTKGQEYHVFKYNNEYFMQQIDSKNGTLKSFYPIKESDLIGQYPEVILDKIPTWY